MNFYAAGLTVRLDFVLCSRACRPVGMSAAGDVGPVSVSVQSAAVRITALLRPLC